MKYLAITLLVLAAALWGYNIGSLEPRVAAEPKLDGYIPSWCDDVVRVMNSNTHEWEKVCEVTMHGQDSNLKIFRKE